MKMDPQLTFREGVIAIIFNDENRFLLVNLLSYAPNQWTFVGGGIEPGETKKEALWREIKEEINLNKEDFEFLGQYKTPLIYTYSKKIVEKKVLEGKYFKGQRKYQFILKLVSTDAKMLVQKEEIRKYKWVDYSGLRDHLIFEGQFENAKKVIGSIGNKLDMQSGHNRGQ